MQRRCCGVFAAVELLEEQLAHWSCGDEVEDVEELLTGVRRSRGGRARGRRRESSR